MFLFELRGVPAGTVALSWNEDTGEYRYTSTQVFSREGSNAERRRSVAFRSSDGLRDAKSGRFLQSLYLWRGPRTPGCVEASAELGGQRGEICLEPIRGSASSLRGTVFGDRFEATLSATGELQTLALGPARFTRVAQTHRVTPGTDLFAEGWEITGETGELALSSSSPVAGLPGAAPERPFVSLQAARALSRTVHESFESQAPSAADFAHDESATSASCLGHARRFIARAEAMGADAVMVQGLFAELGASRAFGHAWVRVRVGQKVFDLDPTWQVPVTPATHLPLAVISGNQRAGAAWLPLLSGEARPERRTPRPARGR